MDHPSRSSKTDRGTSRRSSSARRETTASRLPSQRHGQQQQQQQQAGRSARPEAFYASVEPLSARRGLHNSLLARVPDPDTNSAPNSPLPRQRGGATASARTLQQASSLPRQQRSSVIGTSVRRTGSKSSPNVNEEYIKSSVVGRYYGHAGVSRREIIGRRCVGSQPQQSHYDDNGTERFAQTLRHRWIQRATTEEGPRGCNERVNNNTLMPEPWLEERPRTLPSIVRKSRGGFVESYNGMELLLPEGRRVSRQDIVNKRTNSFAGDNTSHGLIRRRSSGALEVAGLSQSQTTGLCRNDNGVRCDEYVRKNSSFVKNASSSQQRSAQRDQQPCGSACNTARRRRDGSMERSRAGGSRSVADFLTVSTRLRDMTRGLVPRPSTLPKIVHSSRGSRAESDWTGIGRSYRDLACREAPIYGKIRRRKLSLPSRESQIRKSTSSLARFARGKSSASYDSDLETADNSRTRSTREAHTDPIYRRRIEASASLTDMRIECKSNPIYGRVLRTNTSSSKSSSQTTGAGGGLREVKYQETRDANANDRKSAQHAVAATAGREVRHVSRRRIIDNVEDTNESPIGSPTAGRLHTSSMREIDYATIDFGVRRSAGMTKRRESSSSATKRNPGSTNESETKSMQRIGGRRTGGRSDEIEYTTWNRETDKSRDDRGKRGETRGGSQEVSSRSARCNHASTTLPSNAKSVRKSSSSASSGIPLKLSTRAAENRQATVESNKNAAKSTSKSAKDRTNYVKKSVAAHVKSFSAASSPRSESPGPSSSIFGFCTGRRKVRDAGKIDGRDEKTLSRRVRGFFVTNNFFLFRWVKFIADFYLFFIFMEKADERKNS